MQKMLTQIVVPLDGSRMAEKSIPHAVALARATGRGLTLLQVVPKPEKTSALAWGAPPVSAASALHEEKLTSAGEYLQNVTLRIAGYGGDAVPVRSEVLDGDAAEAIVVYAEEHPEVLMLVMATRGRSGLTRWVLGSVAEKVLEVSPVPLALIRCDAVSETRADAGASAFGSWGLPPVPDYRTILVPLDYSVLAEGALPQAMELANATGASLLLVSVLPLPDPVDLPVPPQAKRDESANSDLAEVLLPPRQNLRKVFEDLHEREKMALTQYMSSVAHRVEGAISPETDVRIQVMEGDAAKEILRAGQEADADLIVMSTNGRGGLSRLWLGHVALKVVREAAVPVLLMREKLARQPAQ